MASQDFDVDAAMNMSTKKRKNIQAAADFLKAQADCTAGYMVSEGSEKLELPQQVNLTAALLKYFQVVLDRGGRGAGRSRLL